MWASKDGVLDAKGLDAYLDRFYGQDGPKIGCAFPGFHDIYQQAGVQPSHGYLDAGSGETFRHTLGRAVASGSPIIQVATWNDFGEGTSIEPTREYGYRYLEAVQDARRRSHGEPFDFRPDDLRLPLRIYALRKKIAASSPDRKILDEAVDLLLVADSPQELQRIGAWRKSLRRPYHEGDDGRRRWPRSDPRMACRSGSSTSWPLTRTPGPCSTA
jgi:hypothetical protein